MAKPTVVMLILVSSEHEEESDGEAEIAHLVWDSGPLQDRIVAIKVNPCLVTEPIADDGVTIPRGQVQAWLEKHVCGSDSEDQDEEHTCGSDPEGRDE